MIDIIIPMYNARTTIERTLESILKQGNEEIINVYLIDDSSDDSYDDVVEKYDQLLSINYQRLNKKGGPYSKKLWNGDIKG